MRRDSLLRLEQHGIRFVPAGWTQSRVKYLGDYINGFPFKPDDWGTAGRPILRIQNLSSSDQEPNRYDGEISSRYLVQPGDILISWSASLGVYRWAGEESWLNQHIFKVALNTKRVRDDFFLWLSEWFINEMDREVHGSTMQHLTADTFGGFPVLLPSQAEQARIADYLDRETAQIDALVAVKERVLALLAEKRRALITRAVTRGLDPHTPLRDSGITRLGEIPEHWGIWKLGHLALIGNGSTPSRDNPDYWMEGTIPWLNSAVVNQEEVSAADQFVTPTAFRECHLPLVNRGSVLVAITGQGKTRGQAAVVSFDTTISQHLAFVSPDRTRLDPWYLRWILYAAYDFLRSISDDAGGTKGALTCEEVANLRVPVPPIPEQIAIVEKVRAQSARLDALRAATERTITLLKERRAALIAAAVTGQIDLESMA